MNIQIRSFKNFQMFRLLESFLQHKVESNKLKHSVKTNSDFRIRANPTFKDIHTLWGNDNKTIR